MTAHQCIIAHPVNPPYYAPMVEIIPHDQTTQEIYSKIKFCNRIFFQTGTCIQHYVTYSMSFR